MTASINKGQASYEPNSIDEGWPKATPPASEHGGFESYYERVDAHKVRARSPSFLDHYSQATLFWNSQTEVEQQHIIEAISFELSKVTRPHIRERVIANVLPNISLTLAKAVAESHGLPVPEGTTASAASLGSCSLKQSPSLSLMARPPQGIKYRQVAVLIANGMEDAHLEHVRSRLKEEGAKPVLIAPSMAPVTTVKGAPIKPDATLEGQPSVTMDAVIIIGGAGCADALAATGQGRYYLKEAYKHLKVIAALGEAKAVVVAADLPTAETGMISGQETDAALDQFVTALSQHRVWSRHSKIASIPA